VDRDLARRNITSGLLAASIALLFFALAFFVSILYIA
jgi:uncharacterized membrane protein